MVSRDALATLSFLGLVPAAVGLAYAGYWAGIYPYVAIPAAFGGVMVLALAGLFAVLARRL